MAPARTADLRLFSSGSRSSGPSRGSAPLLRRDTLYMMAAATGLAVLFGWLAVRNRQPAPLPPRLQPDSPQRGDKSPPRLDGDSGASSPAAAAAAPAGEQAEADASID
jgi:hypothetical protein